MTETVLLNSGDIFFRPSSGGSNALLPVDRKAWLNEQIVKMCDDIVALQGSTGKPGLDGRNVMLRVGIFPEGAADLPENYAILWRAQPRPGEIETPWQVLARMRDLVGPQGPEGPQGAPGEEGQAGAPGTSVKFSGAVEKPTDLLTLTGVSIGDGYLVKSLGNLFVLTKEPSTLTTSWLDAGKIKGEKGDRGPKGARGPQGPQGAQGMAGGISTFLLQWVVDTATNQAISYVMMDVNSMINDAINDMANQLMSMAEDAAKDAVEKAIEDMMDEFKGEKGDKGDYGEKGKDGTSFKLVGRFDTVAQFQLQFPASEDTVGFAAMIGPENSTELEMWAITQSSFLPGITPVYKYEKYGKLQGPKGADAEWKVSVRDKDFVETKNITVVSDLPSGVAGMYIQETDSILVEGLSGSAADAKQVGFRMSMKYPIPKLVKEGDAMGIPTNGKVLSNDGEKLKWVDGGTGGSSAKDEILLKASDGRIWAIGVDDTGRMTQELSIETTDEVMLKVKSPNGQNWGITIGNNGRMNISEVI